MLRGKILYIHQYFKTLEEGGATRSFYIAQALAEAGFEVEILTTHNKPTYLLVEIAGFKVHYLPIYYDNKLNFWQRAWAFLRFMYQSYRRANKITHINIVYATSTPLTVGITALLLLFFKKIPYIFEVRDLWPQAPIEMGFVRNALWKRLLYALEKIIYQKASYIIALSEGIQTYIRTKVPNKTIYLIPNMADTAFFQPITPDNQLIKQYGLAGKKVVSYFGTLGKANHLYYLLDIAHLAQKQGIKSLHFFIIGKGAEAEALQNYAQELKNVYFIKHLSKAELRNFLSITAVSYISFKKIPVLSTTSPNKLFDSLAAGKLCVVNVEGWLADIVQNNACGFYANPTNPQEFLDKLAPFLQDEALLHTYQVQARATACRYFDRKLLCQAVVEVVRKALLQG